MTQATQREIVVQDSFRANNPTSIEARMEAIGPFGLEYLNETTGERRIVNPGRPISHNEAFQIANEHRHVGEVFLQVVTLEEKVD